jgi:hypothetical protein
MTRTHTGAKALEAIVHGGAVFLLPFGFSPMAARLLVCAKAKWRRGPRPGLPYIDRGVRLARPAVAGGIRRVIRAGCCARTGWLVGSWAQWLTSIPHPREQRLTSGPKCKRASVRWSVGCAGEIPWWAELVSEAQVRFSFPFSFSCLVFFYNYFESSLNLNINFSFGLIIQIQNLVLE